MENTTVNDHFSRLDRLIKEYQQSEYTDISYLSPDEQKAEHTRQQQVCKNARKECRDLIRELNINGITRSRKKVIKSRIRDEIKTFFLTQKLDNSASGRKSTLKSLNSIISRYVSADGILGMNSLRRICFPSVSSSEYLLRCITDQMDPQEEAIIKKLKKVQQIMKINTNELLRQELGGNRYADSFFRSVREKFTFDVISDLVSRNPYYRKYFRNLREIEIRSARITQGLLDAIPDTYPDLFPLARQMQRHFILHIGPTNSGKSHDALIALKEAATGVYLAPLRLLAYEKYEELNEDGIWCSLKTGEEEIIVPGAQIRSSTIEVLDFTRHYETAVIDEGQMVCDRQRGSAWTMAYLGVLAETVHVCLAPEAEKVLTDIIKACDDTYEIIRHERLVPLISREYSEYIFPGNAQPGDAFIVFSRRDVHAVAATLQQYGHKCSIIYGNLPYDVRRGEVKRYINGETDVVVATDAIGMGLNLPIKRIVFLALSKFDGISDRMLTPSEIKQIAGRAGRYGIFPKGIVTSDTDFEYLEYAVHDRVSPIANARIGFPYSMIGIEGHVSELMEQWGRIKPKRGFEVADMSREIELARVLEKETDDKELVYRFVMFPFDEKNELLMTIWLDLFNAQLCGRNDFMKWLPSSPSGTEESLKDLEDFFKICDMLYHYADTFEHSDAIPGILSRKRDISSSIMLLLSKEKLEAHICSICKKPLPLHYPYKICRECYKKQHLRKGRRIKS